MDKLQWFKFSYADWRMGKIQRCPEVTQARFLNLCCLYWSKESEVSREDAEIEIDKEHLDILISKKIIEINDDYISIKFLDEQLEGIAETSKGKSKAAKVRWDKYRKDKESAMQNNADAMHVHTDAMQNNAEKRREEKSRGEKRREEEKREENTNNTLTISNEINKNSLLYKIDQSVLEGKDLNYYKIALSFYDLFKLNLQEAGMNSKRIDKTKYLTAVNPIRKLFEIDGVTKDQLISVFHFLKRNEFWKSNIQSSLALRKQIEKLLLAIKSEKINTNPKTKKEEDLQNYYKDLQERFLKM
jgi:hypothetical protein